MEYFMIETGNRIPYNINKNHIIDSWMLTKEKLNKLPEWNVVEMNLPDEAFFPDIICSPFVLLSRVCIKTVLLYQPELPYKGIKLWEKESCEDRTYFLTVPDELECMSDKTQFNSTGNRIIKLVLDRNKIGDQVFFKVKGLDRSAVVGRMDVVESMLRRGMQGFTLAETEVEERSGL